MAVEGVIVSVMETFPIQLTIKSNTHDVHIMLRTDTRVSKGTLELDPSDLRPGQYVIVQEEQPIKGAGVTAIAVEIQQDVDQDSSQPSIIQADDASIDSHTKPAVKPAQPNPPSVGRPAPEKPRKRP